mgnify:CR=1 FL=1
MNIVLIGFMGVGKTTVAKILANELSMKFVETDLIIEERAGKSIPEIFNDNGENAFRRIESDVIRAVSNKDNLVISCGGGVVTNNINISNLKKNGKIILLTAREENIINRVKDSEQRPLLNTKEWETTLHNLLVKREPIYKKASDFVIETDELGPEEVADKVASIFEKE